MVPLLVLTGWVNEYIGRRECGLAVAEIIGGARLGDGDRSAAGPCVRIAANDRAQDAAPETKGQRKALPIGATLAAEWKNSFMAPPYA